MTRVAARKPAGTIANYSIISKIRVGSQSAVYRCRNPRDGQEVAVKVLADAVTKDEVLRLRFAQECQVARRLQHPHIVRVLDYGLDGDKPYLVMEYVLGESLSERLNREGKFPEADAIAIVTQIGQALHWAHGRGLIHRDVTPDNILVSTDGAAKLTDLGLVKNLEGDFNLTQTQSALGAPNFMAPEQFEDAKHVDAQSDLYALAATLYLALTGAMPFSARSSFAVGAIYKKKLANDIIPPRQLASDVSEHVSDQIVRALRSERKERHANVLEFVDSLAHSQPPAAVAAAGNRPSRRPLLADAGNRRRHERIPVHISACCQPFERADSKTWKSIAINLSESGFCLEVDRQFEPGTVLAVRLEGRKLCRRSLLARVMWVKKQTEGAWRVGCQSTGPLTLEEIHELR